MSVIPDTDFGIRVRARLHDELVVWLTTTGKDGTPQPNPVWFLWDDAADTVLIYNLTTADRLAHVTARPQVSLNFDGDGQGGDIVVLTGVAEPAANAVAADVNDAYLAKYAAAIDRLGSDPAGFAKRYSTALHIRIRKVRGH